MVTEENFIDEFEYVIIAHNREDEGYDGNWYDVENNEQV
jgi:hypothetical protein